MMLNSWRSSQNEDWWLLIEAKQNIWLETYKTDGDQLKYV